MHLSADTKITSLGMSLRTVILKMIITLLFNLQARKYQKEQVELRLHKQFLLHLADLRFACPANHKWSVSQRTTPGIERPQEHGDIVEHLMQLSEISCSLIYYKNSSWKNYQALPEEGR